MNIWTSFKQPFREMAFSKTKSYCCQEMVTVFLLDSSASFVGRYACRYQYKESTPDQSLRRLKSAQFNHINRINKHE